MFVHRESAETEFAETRSLIIQRFLVIIASSVTCTKHIILIHLLMKLDFRKQKLLYENYHMTEIISWNYSMKTRYINLFFDGILRHLTYIKRVIFSI